MRIQLGQIEDEPFRWDVTETLDPETLDQPALVQLGPIHWRGAVQRADPGFLVRARLDYEQTLRCDRCLADTASGVESPVEFVALVDADQEEPEERELSAEDLGLVVLPEDVLDMEPVLLEQVQLNVPMKPLCRPDCKGLCSRCGADLNEGPCSCEPEPVDSRWDALASLRDKLSDD